MLTDTTVVLREFRDDDLPALQSLRNDVPTQIALLSQPRPNSAMRVREWVTTASGLADGVFFVIEHEATCAGFVQLRAIDTLHGTAELGIALCPPSRGKHLAARVIQLVEAYGHDVFRLRKLILRVLSSNERAIGVYRSVGYRIVGVYEKHAWVSGAYEDVTIMEHFLGETV